MIHILIRHLAIAVTAILFTGVLAAQNTWVRQSPLPTGRNLNGGGWATATLGFAAGEGGTLIKTSDGGETWENVDVDIFPDEPFYNLLCRDAQNCFVIGNSGTGGPDHWRTVDGGSTWQRITEFPLGGSWRQIDFVSPTTGFMGSNGGTARTLDAGATWHLMSGWPSCPVMYTMDFRDAQVGLVGGNRVSTTDGGPGIFKTTDAGETWVRKFELSANSILWVNDSTALAIIGSSIYRSVDEGETWALVNNANASGLVQMVKLQDGTIVGVSSKGDVWRSSDNGTVWTRTFIGPGTPGYGWNISFLDNELGMMVGPKGAIYGTVDGGFDWTRKTSGIGGIELNDIEMFDDTTGLAVGDNAHYLRTTSGGDNWAVDTLRVTGPVVYRNEHLNAVSVVDEEFAVAAGDDGVVYKTFDRGITWQSIGYPKLPGYYFVSDVAFATRDFGYVVGSRPGYTHNVYRTTDGGATWELMSVGSGHTVDVVGVDHAWVVNLGGLGHRTTDGGANWEPMELPDTGSSVIINKIDFINENEGWAVGWYGYVAHTIDGGRTWTMQSPSSNDEIIFGVHVLSPTEVFLVSTFAGASNNPPRMYHTNDAGSSWISQPLPAQYSLSSIFATRTGKIWVTGFDGVVLHNPEFSAPAPSLLLTFAPTRVIGGNASQGTVRLAEPAPVGGSVVALTSGNSFVTVPATVTVPEGKTSVSFPVETLPVDPNDPSLRVTVTANGGAFADTADITVAPPFTCNYSISPANEYFGFPGGRVVVHVTATPGCNWTAGTNRPFITFPDGNSGTGSGRVTVAVSPNTVTLFKFGFATIAGKTFGMNQAPAGGCEFALSSTAAEIHTSGGTGTVGVTMNNQCFEGWAARSNEDWITVTPTEGDSNTEITYTVATNETGSPRSGTFTVSGLVFTINQRAPQQRGSYDGLVIEH